MPFAVGRTALLDTHAFVWAISDPDSLGVSARRFITDPTNSLLVSAASAWELSTKVRLGKFSEAAPLVDRYDDLVRALRAESLPISAGQALRAGQLRWEHRDPFDRMLAAQALDIQVPLLTRDREFAALAGLDVVW